jgi:carbamoyl-phosphate synthase large subunit
VLIEESVLGWKEFELEVMRDHARQRRHHLLDRELRSHGRAHRRQHHRRARADAHRQGIPGDARRAIAIIREIGVDTGGSNIQFAVNPETAGMVVIEMNPRVSRSSALASKGHRLPHRQDRRETGRGLHARRNPNDITRETPASFEPTIDYVVTKIPALGLREIPRRGRPGTLTVQMKSVGETMSIGRTFKESLQKGLRSLEIGRYGLGATARQALTGEPATPEEKEALLRAIRTPNAGPAAPDCRGVRAGATVEDVHEATFIDPWFLRRCARLSEKSGSARRGSRRRGGCAAPRNGFSRPPTGLALEHDRWPCAHCARNTGSCPTYKLVDTCAAEFEAYTPYYYSTYGDEDEVRDRPTREDHDPRRRPEPHRPGHRIRLLLRPCRLRPAEDGYETIMVNSNPETVSTDYDTSDRLYFEPVTSKTC